MTALFDLDADLPRLAELSPISRTHCRCRTHNRLRRVRASPG